MKKIIVSGKGCGKGRLLKANKTIIFHAATNNKKRFQQNRGTKLLPVVKTIYATIFFRDP